VQALGVNSSLMAMAAPVMAKAGGGAPAKKAARAAKAKPAPVERTRPVRLTRGQAAPTPEVRGTRACH
jgi:hypothetical protein